MSDAVPPSVRDAFHGPLLDWFAANQRAFPWRTWRSPYRVWVSELMLQQTRADQALPYYLRFMRRFPSLRRLAAASLDDVLKAWEGLGYYARARNLHRSAQFLIKERGGRLPRTHAQLLELPGVGPYTAAAIASLAYGEDVAAVDGNVIRVLSRVMAWEGDAAAPGSLRQFQRWADTLLPPGRAGAFNEAVMELGASLCSPRSPRCGDCPLGGVCQARASGEPERWPRKRKKPRVPHKVVGAAVVADDEGRLLIARRRNEDMLGGLWEFPGGTLEEGETLSDCVARELKEEMDIVIAVGERLATVRHAYSHFTIELHAFAARIVGGSPKALGCDTWAWVTPSELSGYAFSRADLKIIERLLSDEK